MSPPSTNIARSISDYQHGGHRLLNRVLWQSPNGFRELSAPDAGLVIRLRRDLAYLARQVGVPSQIIVWRGVPTSHGLDHLQLAAGDRIRAHLGFMSTSVSRLVAESRMSPTDPQSVLWQLTVPTGCPGAWLPPYGAPIWRFQAEFLIPPGARILVSQVVVQNGLGLIAGEVY